MENEKGKAGKYSLQKNRQLLNADKYGYTDEDVIKIVEFIHRLSAIDYSLYKESKRVIRLENNIDDALNRKHAA